LWSGATAFQLPLPNENMFMNGDISSGFFQISHLAYVITGGQTTCTLPAGLVTPVMYKLIPPKIKLVLKHYGLIPDLLINLLACS
jgi:hypothetical protein